MNWICKLSLLTLIFYNSLLLGQSELQDIFDKVIVENSVSYSVASKQLKSIESLFSDIESLQLYAGIHAIHFGYHRLLAKRFPFAIYYKLNKDIIRVYAILDCRRNPAWIRNRLS